MNKLEHTISEYSHSEIVLFHAANVLFLCDYREKANNYVDQILSQYPSSVDGYLIKGWLELKDNKLKSARNCFKAVLSQVSDLLKFNQVYICSLNSKIYYFCLETRFD